MSNNFNSLYDIVMRNFIKDALVISVRPQGENNRTVCLLTDDGIEYATLYGGPKSRIKALVSPWNRGIMYIYSDPSKNSSKITDFDVKQYHPSFRESLFKSWAAAFAGEIVVKTKCAGSPGQAFFLLNGFLDGLELTEENTGRRGLIRFLWRYLELLGVRPDTSRCAECGKDFFAGKNEDFNVSYSGKISYSHLENGFLCGECSAGSRDFPELSESSLLYLNISEGSNMQAARQFPLEERHLNELRQFVFSMIENAAGLRFRSLESGAGIL